jgi:hypothetical protein
MKRCILDQSGVCVNIIVAETEDPAFLSSEQSYAPDHNGEVGWVWGGSAWIEPVVEAPALSHEDAAASVRRERDARLLASDWVVVLAYERGEAVPQLWLDYRQALRDVPTQVGFPYSVEWPTTP